MVGNAGGPWGSREVTVVSPDVLKLLCPSCGEENALEVGQEFKCRKCEALLSGEKPYSQLTVGVAWVLALLSGSVVGGGVWAVSEFVGQNRYPVLVEHAIIEKCVGGSTRILAAGTFKEKRAICGCALERVQSDFDDDERKKKNETFLHAFGEQAIACVKEREVGH